MCRVSVPFSVTTSPCSHAFPYSLNKLFVLVWFPYDTTYSIFASNFLFYQVNVFLKAFLPGKLCTTCKLFLAFIFIGVCSAAFVADLGVCVLVFGVTLLAGLARHSDILTWVPLFFVLVSFVWYSYVILFSDIITKFTIASHIDEISSA